eukprot:5005029-Pyramimonas_sp.AAC.1
MRTSDLINRGGGRHFGVLVCSFLDLHAYNTNFSNWLLNTPKAGLPCLEKAVLVAQVALMSTVASDVDGPSTDRITTSTGAGIRWSSEANGDVREAARAPTA